MKNIIRLIHSGSSLLNAQNLSQGKHIIEIPKKGFSKTSEAKSKQAKSIFIEFEKKQIDEKIGIMATSLSNGKLLEIKTNSIFEFFNVFMKEEKKLKNTI